MLESGVATVAPYGSWESPITIDLLVGESSVGLAYVDPDEPADLIAPPMPSVFNRPVLAHEVQEPLRRSLLRREAGDAIDHLGVGLLSLLHRAGQAKDLGDARPLPSQKVIEFGSGHQFADFQAPISAGPRMRNSTNPDTLCARRCTGKAHGSLPRACRRLSQAERRRASERGNNPANSGTPGLK